MQTPIELQKPLPASNQASGRESEFLAEGSIAYSAEFRSPTGREQVNHSRRFVVARKGQQWKIRTTNLLSDRFAYGDDYGEMGCDGTKIFELKSFDGNNPDLSAVKDIITAQGRVRHGNTPVGFYLDFVYPLWIAYCSSDFFLSLKDNRLAAPLFITIGSLLDDVRPPLCLPVKWKLNASNFISEIAWHSEGRYLHEEIAANRLETYPAPFNIGFLQASFETTEWISFSEMFMPKGFVLTVFAPNWPAEGEAKCVVSYTVNAELQAVHPLHEFSYLPELTKKTRITDTRYRLCAPCSGHPTYAGSTWMTEEEVEAKNRSLGIEYEMQTSQG